MKSKISILLPDLRGGGVERIRLVLANEFARAGHKISFVLMQSKGELLKEAKDKFKVIDLATQRVREVPLALNRYLRQHRPDVLISAIWPLSVIAPISVFFSRHRCKVLVSEHNNLSIQYSNWGLLNYLLMRASMAVGYRLANSRVGVSKGVVDDIAKLSCLKKKMFEVIHNPIRPFLEPTKQSLQYAENLWSCQSGSRIVTVGSFKAQKNHKLLLNAFARINLPNSRLMFVGDGKERESLLSTANELGINEKIILTGFCLDPTPFYKTADLFVLSSDYEGFGNVIIEALACGIPVVSTDCPSGPAEILDNGRFGLLVPTKDVSALANAIKVQLNSKVNRNTLMNRASEFSAEIVARKYLKSINEIF